MAKVWILFKFGFRNKSKISDLFRHTRAMHLYQHGMDLTLISQWLGHEHLETTLVYAHADTEAKRAAIERAMEGNKVSADSGTRYTIDDEATIRHLYGL